MRNIDLGVLANLMPSTAGFGIQYDQVAIGALVPIVADIGLNYVDAHFMSNMVNGYLDKLTLGPVKGSDLKPVLLGGVTGAVLYMVQKDSAPARANSHLLGALVGGLVKTVGNVSAGIISSFLPGTAATPDKTQTKVGEAFESYGRYAAFQTGYGNFQLVGPGNWNTRYAGVPSSYANRAGLSGVPSVYHGIPASTGRQVDHSAP